MTSRRDVLALGVLAGTAFLARAGLGLAADECSAATRAEAIGSALLDKYVAAVNAHDTSSFPELHTESYIQHSGRSPNGLAAQIENFRGIFGPHARRPDPGRGQGHRWRQSGRTHELFRHAHPTSAGHRPDRATLHIENHRYLAR